MGIKMALQTGMEQKVLAAMHIHRSRRMSVTCPCACLRTFPGCMFRSKHVPNLMSVKQSRLPHGHGSIHTAMHMSESMSMHKSIHMSMHMSLCIMHMHMAMHMAMHMSTRTCLHTCVYGMFCIPDTALPNPSTVTNDLYLAWP